MHFSRALSGASLVVALTAFGLTGALSFRAHVEPFYAVLRSIGAFAAVLCLARWSASALESLEAPSDLPPPAEPFGDDRASSPRRSTRAGNRL
ncbi:MAG TPA: hypothetical protein VMY87_12165 [Armatimonadota bacterium]|nr:hypothetical protein [Armatimonadota bacterium]